LFLQNYCEQCKRK